MLRVLLLVSLISAYLGGWAGITAEAPPEYVGVARPATLTFTVRQHGATRLSGPRPRIEARAGDVTAQAMATPGTEAGQYVASLTLPRASAWTITIYSGFGTSRVTLPPLLAIARGAQPPLTPPESQRGRRLFVAKGSVTSHVHGDIEGSGTVAVGPALTGRRWPAEHLKLFRANPAIAPPRGTLRMPDL